AALRPALLTAQTTRGRERLASLRLRPELVLQRLGVWRRQVEGLERLRLSLDPEAPLQRGYVLVSDAEGRVVKSRAVAARAASLRLKFADGAL
ncbi:exodeoxyribonuclease VII large subunit, partial [Acinetobacter baumannii]